MFSQTLFRLLKIKFLEDINLYFLTNSSFAFIHIQVSYLVIRIRIMHKLTLRTDMDVLVLGDYYVTDRNEAAIQLASERFQLTM